MMNRIDITKNWFKAFLAIAMLTVLAVVFFLSRNYASKATCRLPKCLELKADSPNVQVTSEEIEQEKEHELYAYAKEETVIQRGAKAGDIIYLRYNLFADEELLSSTEQYVESFILGEEYFPYELEKQLYGLAVDDKFKVEETFSDEYPDVAVRGKTVRFEGQIVKITELIFPELSDEFVRENLNYNSISEYKEYLYNKIYGIKYEMALEAEKQRLVSDVIMETEYDEDVLKEETEKRYNEVIESYKRYAELFGYSTEDVYSMFDTSADELYEIALYTQKKVFFCNAVIDKKKLMPSKVAYDNMRLDYAKEYGYNSAEEFADDNGDTFLNECVNEKIVKDYLYSLAIKD